jgi:hypothetical protein
MNDLTRNDLPADPADIGTNVSNNPSFTEDRQRMIAEAAYYRAHARGFAPGYELEDWLQAEAEVNRILKRD